MKTHASFSTVHLRNGGVSLVIGGAVSGQPSIVHWGRDLGPLTHDELYALDALSVQGVANNSLDVPLIFSLWPDQHDGWMGTPFMAGHVDGVATTSRLFLEHVSYPTRVEGGQSVTFTLVDPVPALRVESTLELTGQGLLQVHTSISRAENAIGFYDLGCANVLLPLPSHAVESLDLTGKWSRERQPQRRPIQDGTWRRDMRRGKPGADSPYLLAAGTRDFQNRTGEVWAAHLAWSGNSSWFVERLPEGAGPHSSVIGVGEMLAPGEVRLAAGQTYSAPMAVFAWTDRGLDGISDRFHSALRSRAHHPLTPRPIIVNTWEATYFDHDAGRLIALADEAARVGAERFVLDDGWFGDRRDDSAGLGDWQVSRQMWPHGLNVLSDHVHGLGMQFGLWFEPEMLNLDSDLARAHPEWILAPSQGVGASSRNQHVLNIAHPDAFAYLLDAIDSLVRELNIDYIKWDHNRELHEAVSRHAAGDRPGVHAQTMALYRLLDELRSRHPGMEIESCASGGGRVDLGILERTDRVWASDCIDPVERESIQRWSMLLLPPELVGAHVGVENAHTTHRKTSLPLRLASALIGHSGIELNLPQLSPDERQDVVAWVALVKQWRDHISRGTVVHADIADESLSLTGVVSPDADRALFAYTRTTTSGAILGPRLAFPGLNADVSYRVRVITDLGHPLMADDLAPAWMEHPTGVDLPGGVLSTVGLPMPQLQPAQTMLMELRALNRPLSMKAV